MVRGRAAIVAILAVIVVLGGLAYWWMRPRPDHRRTYRIGYGEDRPYHFTGIDGQPEGTGGRPGTGSGPSPGHPSRLDEGARTGPRDLTIGGRRFMGASHHSVRAQWPGVFLRALPDRRHLLPDAKRSLPVKSADDLKRGGSACSISIFTSGTSHSFSRMPDRYWGTPSPRCWPRLMTDGRRGLCRSLHWDGRTLVRQRTATVAPCCPPPCRNRCWPWARPLLPRPLRTKFATR